MKCRAMVVMMLTAVAMRALAYREGDTQLWLSEGVEAGAGKDVRVGFDANSRWGDSMREHFYQSYEPAVTWKAASWLELSLSTEFSQSRKGGEWLDEWTPKASIQLRGDSGPLTLSNRSRMEYRLREEANDEWRYRDRLRLQVARGWTECKIRPYVEEELYFSCDEQQFNESRAAVGVGAEFHARVKAELYFLVRSQLKDDLWTDSHAVGAKVALMF